MSLNDIKNLENIYLNQVQFELITAIRAGSIGKAIATAIEIHQKRNQIMVGLHNRSNLKSATTEEWPDPREADGVPIFARTPPSATKENHKLHTPFDRVIAMQKASYMVGITPELVIEGGEATQSRLNDELKTLAFDKGISELGQSSTGRGTSFALLFTPPQSKDMRITFPDNWGCFVLYSPETGLPEYAVRYWVEIRTEDEQQPDNDESRKITGEFYTVKDVQAISGSWGDVLLAEPEGHMFEGVPLIEFANNTERLSDVELTMSLQDAYDIADSDLSSEISQLRLSYLSLPDSEIDIDADWLKTLKQTGVFIGDGKFIEKNINAQAVENIKQDLEMRIYKYSNSYNPDELGADKALTAFQIQQKLLRLESSSKETEMLFKIALNYMLRLIAKFKNISYDESKASWKFTRNTPRNAMEDLKLAVESGFKFSQKMMVRIFPFELNQEANEKELSEETPFGGAAEGEPLAGIGGGGTEEAIEVAKLSGIQIGAANDIIGGVARGELSREAGINQLKTFLGLNDAQANAVMGKVTIKKAVKPVNDI